MKTLNLPPFTFRVTEKNGKFYIFDPVRKKQLVLTPEEWVRQHFVQFLINDKQCPASLISLEGTFVQHKISRRSDIVVYSASGKPLMLVECKATHVKINQTVFDQIAAYNAHLGVPVLVVSNGLKHYCCKVDATSGQWEFLKNIPCYSELSALGI